MKLVLANNQSDQFVQYHTDIQTTEKIYDYAGYDSLLFYFDSGTAEFWNTQSGRHVSEYSGVYINGYLQTPDTAFTVASVLDFQSIPYRNSELKNAPSLTKLSASAKLAVNDIVIPKSYAGSPCTLALALTKKLLRNITAPYVLKRVDVDRGIDNFLVSSDEELAQKLHDVDPSSMWIVQEFVPNDGYYVVTVNVDEVKFSIFRSLETRPDGKKHKAHMYKPKGGVNATLLGPSDIPNNVKHLAVRACRVLGREIASVDILLHQQTKVPVVLEVNYNPQLVTASVYKVTRQDAFVESVMGIE